MRYGARRLRFQTFRTFQTFLNEAALKRLIEFRVLVVV